MKGFLKNVVTILIVAVALVTIGCNACAKCTDPQSGFSDEYCGKKTAAEAYARELRSSGWECTVD